MPDVKVPLLGNVPKGAVVAGLGSAVVVTGYLIYKHNKQNTAAAGVSGTSGYGYGSGMYGYASGYYGYGSEFQPYPVGSEYGYGAYGYGYYNPYTGQWIGSGGGGGTTGQPPPGPKPTPQKGKQVKIGSRTYWYNPTKQTISTWVGKGKNRRYVHYSI